mgnify:CR=1 FL=1
MARRAGTAGRSAEDRLRAASRALAEDLQRYLDGEPILARPPSLTYRFRKFARRHRALVASDEGLVHHPGPGQRIADSVGLDRPFLKDPL